MLTASSEHQASFFDVDYLCANLIPPESYYRKFREVVWPLLTDEAFASMYCQDNGRPPIAPRLLAMALLLQFHQDLSDREMERACMYDLEVKYALGLRLDERPFDHSSLGDFRQRLLAAGRPPRAGDRPAPELRTDLPPFIGPTCAALLLLRGMVS